MPTTYRQTQKSHLRDTLYSAALDLIRRHGYEATTVEAIAKRTGVSKGTFFNYFETKERVIQEWYRRMTLAGLEEAEGQTFDSARSAILGLVDALARRAIKEPQLCAATARSSIVSPLLSEEEKQLDDRLAIYFENCLRAGQERAEIDATLDIPLVAATVIAAISGTSREWQASNNSMDLRATLRERVGFILRATRPAPEGTQS